MGTFFLMIAMWNTLVALANVFLILPGLPAEALQFCPLRAQTLPVAIPLCAWFYCQDWRYARLD